MFSTPTLSTNNLTEKNFCIIESAFKSVFCTTSTSSPSGCKSVCGSLASDSINKKKSTIKSHLDTPVSNVDKAATKICVDIEKNFSHCISHLGDEVLEAMSPYINKKIEKRAPEFDENGKLKRIRRRPEELKDEKNHMCPYLGCEKTYTSKCSLYLHIKRNHKENEALKEGEVAPVRINSKVKKGVDIYKVFKRAQAVKYEYGAEFEDKTNCDDLDIDTILSEAKIQKDGNMSPSYTYCKSRAELLTQCNTDQSDKNVCGNHHHQTEGGLDLQDFQLAAHKEMFNWSENSNEDEIRKGSLTSILMEEEMNKQFGSSSRKQDMEAEQDEYVTIDGIAFNNDDLLSSEENEEDDRYSYRNSVSFEHNSFLGDEEYESDNFFQSLKDSDFLDLSDENGDDVNRGYDFELEFGMQARKTLVI